MVKSGKFDKTMNPNKSISNNERKYIIDSFANGNLDRIKELYSQYGDKIFTLKVTSNGYRVGRENDGFSLFYSLKHGHFFILEYYFYTCPMDITISNKLADVLIEDIISKDKLNEWYIKYNSFQFKNRIVINDLVSLMCNYSIKHLKYENIYWLIDNFDQKARILNIIDIFSKYNDRYRYKQLKRDLLLRDLV